MASTKWLHWRIWCGRLPTFQLLADEELQVEHSASVYFFGSSELARLRTQIRLKLKEIPPIHQTRRSARTYGDALELLSEYLPYLLALTQFHNPDRLCQSQRQQPQDTIVDAFSFPPLFYGFDSIDLSTDRVFGCEQRISLTAMVDLVLTLLTMAQLQALFAEAQMEQAARLQNTELLQIVEEAWQDAKRQFDRASAFAKHAQRKLPQGRSQFVTVLTFFEEIELKTQLIMLDERTERLGRAVSAYTRCAYSVIQRAMQQIEELPENEFKGQLQWLLKAYQIRWRALHYSAEQTVFQLDFNPEIAIHFLEATSRLRLDPLPTYSHRLDSYFTRIAQELQLVHQEHLNNALGEKKVLSLACQHKLGLPWSTPDGWSKTDNEDLLRLQEVPAVDAGGDCGGYFCSNAGEDESSTICHVLKEREAAVNELLEMIDARIMESAEKAGNRMSFFASDVSLDGTRDTESEDQREQLGILQNLSPEAHAVVMNVGACSPSKSTAYHELKFERNHTHSNYKDQRSNQDAQDAVASTDSIEMHAIKSSSASSSAVLNTVALKKRPSSAQPPVKGSNSTAISQQSTGWVKMMVGGKALHFESADAVSYGVIPSLHSSHTSKSPSRATRRNAIPMALTDEDPSDPLLNVVADSNLADQGGFRKPRPSSCPSYHGVKNSIVSVSQDGTMSVRHHMHSWIPTRGQCALCERRYTRSHLAGVVLMKRIFDLRRKWGMIIQDSKKFNAASSLYANAQVCLFCREILLHEDELSLQAFETEDKVSQALPLATADASRHDPVMNDKDDIGVMIFNSILHAWHQQPHQDDTHLLEDVAINKRARQSSTVFDMDARNAVQLNATRCAHTKEELQPWWEVDLANYYVIHSVKIWLRDEASHLYNGSAVRRGSGRVQAIDGGNNLSKLESFAQQQQLQQRKTVLRSTLQPRPRHLGVFPLHVSVSMKTGVGRDMDEILTSCVSSHCLKETTNSPIVWHAPPNSRGRFVRIQAERQAILHIEKVQVYIASANQHQQRLRESKMRKEALRHQLKRAAFRASIVVNPATTMSDDITAVHVWKEKTKELSPGRHSSSHKTESRTNTLESAQAVHPHALVSTFLDPAQAEKKRISKLYSRFKSLLDARSKYLVEELSHEIRASNTET